MIFQKCVLLVLLNLYASSVDAFVVRTPSSSVAAPSLLFRPSTCLRAEEEGDTETAAEKETVDAGDSAAAATDILSSPAFLKRKVDVLNSDIAKADEDIEEAKQLVAAGKEEWGTQLDSLQSEYKNIQDRMSSQNKQGDTQSTVAVVRELLDVLDNFDRAFGSVKPETDEEKEIEAAYKEVYQMTLDKFKEFGVTEIETVGKEFDYEVHQAVMQRPTDEYEEGFVCDELQRGFVMGDTLIRAAMVSVAA